VRAVLSIVPALPGGYITLARPYPTTDFALLGPFWPLLVLNPLYVWWAHRRGQLVCPLDPKPDTRLWLYRALGCDAVLTDDPAATNRVLGR
jgi:glycerophosphoryl diester phosphodiesterase